MIRTMPRSTLLLLAGGAYALAACGSPTTPDSGVPADVASDIAADVAREAGADATPDVSAPDVAAPDVSAPDVSAPDAAMDAAADVSAPDAAPDVAIVDAGPRDVAVLDVAPGTMRTAYRVDTMTIRDPHPHARIGVCNDLTTTINMQLNTGLSSDADGDGDLDLAVLQTFLPLDPAMGTTASEVVFPACTAPASSSTCRRPTGSTPIVTSAANRATGTCLDLLPSTTRSSYGTITLPSGPCYVSDVGDLPLPLGGGIVVTLRDAKIAATYTGTPTNRLANGLIRGFLTEADANATTIPSSILFVGGMRLSAILPGGMGNCQTGANSDVDMLPDGTRGWYFYINFTAVPAPYTP